MPPDRTASGSCRARGGVPGRSSPGRASSSKHRIAPGDRVGAEAAVGGRQPLRSSSRSTASRWERRSWLVGHHKLPDGSLAGLSPRPRRSRRAPSRCSRRSPRTGAGRWPGSSGRAAGSSPRKSGTSDRAGSESSSCCKLHHVGQRESPARAEDFLDPGKPKRVGPLESDRERVAAAGGCPGWPWRTSHAAGRPRAAAREWRR